MPALSRTRGGRRLSQYRWARLLLVLGIGISALMVGFIFGQKSAYHRLGMDLQEYRKLRAALPLAQEKIDELQAALEVEEIDHAIDRDALQLLRREIAGQKEEIASLEEGLRFYRGLMAPEEIEEGLSIRPPEIVERDPPSRYAFRIVAQQEALKHELLKGELYVEVFGELGGLQVSYPLAELSEDIGERIVPLRFRYFQALEGELHLPEGFAPVGISIVATANSPSTAEFEERFAWQLHERFTHAGK